MRYFTWVNFKYFVLYIVGWVCKPANYWKFPKVFQIPSKNLCRSSIVVALQPVDGKPVTLVKRELLEFCGTNTNTNANTKFLLLLC